MTEQLHQIDYSQMSNEEFIASFEAEAADFHAAMSEVSAAREKLKNTIHGIDQELEAQKAKAKTLEMASEILNRKENENTKDIYDQIVTETSNRVKYNIGQEQDGKEADAEYDTVYSLLTTFDEHMDSSSLTEEEKGTLLDALDYEYHEDLDDFTELYAENEASKQSAIQFALDHPELAKKVEILTNSADVAPAVPHTSADIVVEPTKSAEEIEAEALTFFEELCRNPNYAVVDFYYDRFMDEYRNLVKFNTARHYDGKPRDFDTSTLKERWETFEGVLNNERDATYLSDEDMDKIGIAVAAIERSTVQEIEERMFTNEAYRNHAIEESRAIVASRDSAGEPQNAGDNTVSLDRLVVPIERYLDSVLATISGLDEAGLKEFASESNVELLEKLEEYARFLAVDPNEKRKFDQIHNDAVAEIIQAVASRKDELNPISAPNVQPAHNTVVVAPVAQAPLSVIPKTKRPAPATVASPVTPVKTEKEMFDEDVSVVTSLLVDRITWWENLPKNDPRKKGTSAGSLIVSEGRRAFERFTPSAKYQTFAETPTARAFINVATQVARDTFGNGKKANNAIRMIAQEIGIRQA